MDFRILGSLEVWDGERQLELGGPKRRAVLAVLLLHANEVVGVDRLVDQLWGDKAPRNAVAALHTHVSRLRKELGPDIVATRAWGYVLRAEPGEIDLERFERGVADAENLPARERADRLREALALWRGAPLEDLSFEPALAKDLARLGELRLTVLENRIDADLEAGNHSGLVGELEALIAEQPMRERLRGQLILALYRCGRQAEALEVYRETRRVLADELGLEPGPELRDLERAILQHDPTLRSTSRDATAEPATAVRPGRRRRAFIGATVLALLIGAGAAAYAVTGRGTHVTEHPPPVENVTHHHTNQPASKRATPVRRHTIHARTRTLPAVLHRAVTRPITVSTTIAAVTTTARATVTKHPTARAQTTTTSRASPQLVRIADDFTDSTLDPLIWSTWSQGTGSGYAQTNGQAVFSIAGDATFEPQYHTAGTTIGTKCKFPGDFDARVDFSLLQWPSANGATISLVAYQAAPVEWVGRQTNGFANGLDGYNAYPNGSGVGPLPDPSGSLRMSRTSGVLRVYFWHHDQWKEIGRISVSGEVWVGLSIGTFADAWQQQDVSAAFQNFVLTASSVDCPAGSDPRNP